MALLRRRRLERIRLENLSLADRLTKRLTGGYSSTQREIELIREHLKTEQEPLAKKGRDRYESRNSNSNSLSLRLPRIIPEVSRE